jgi:hypothetical protein
VRQGQLKAASQGFKIGGSEFGYVFCKGGNAELQSEFGIVRLTENMDQLSFCIERVLVLTPMDPLHVDISRLKKAPGPGPFSLIKQCAR